MKSDNLRTKWELMSRRVKLGANKTSPLSLQAYLIALAPSRGQIQPALQWVWGTEAGSISCVLAALVSCAHILLWPFLEDPLQPGDTDFHTELQLRNKIKNPSVCFELCGTMMNICSSELCWSIERIFAKSNVINRLDPVWFTRVYFSMYLNHILLIVL